MQSSGRTLQPSFLIFNISGRPDEKGRKKMRIVNFVVAMLSEFAVLYLSIDLAKNGESFLSVLAGIVFFVVGTAFTRKAFSGPEDTVKFN